MDATRLYLFALPIFLAAIVAEGLYYRFVLKQAYGWATTGSNLLIFIGRIIGDAASKGLVVAAYVGAYQLRPFDIPMNRWESWLALFFAIELAYYWLHRYSHEVRWMWTQHSVHHSSRQVTLSVAYRLGWTQFISGPWLFLVPVCWIGFDPRAVGLMYAANLIWQFWLHTETIGKLGWAEWIFNTPSHHRVHHAIEPEYLDRNYGGVLIIWDRLFGTFAEERAGVPRTYGLVRQIDTNSPVKIVFAEWLALIRDVRGAKSWRARLGYLFAAPGWQPNGRGATTRAIRAAARVMQDSRTAAPQPADSLRRSLT